MAKGPLITPQVEALIASVYQQHTKWKAPIVRNEVESILRKKNRNSPKGWPSLSIVQKTLATVRKNLANPSPEDEPWSLSTLKDHPISPEALPKVLEEYKRNKLESSTGKGDRLIWGSLKELKEAKSQVINGVIRPIEKMRFTIRDAKWIAQLSATQYVLDMLPYVIAESERLYELIDRPPEWEIYDKLLSGLELEPAEIADITMVAILRKMPYLLEILPDSHIEQLREVYVQYNLEIDRLIKEAKEKGLDTQKEAKNERNHKTKS